MATAALTTSRIAGFAAAGPTRTQRSRNVNVQTRAASKDLTAGQEYALTLPGISAPFPNMFDPAGFTAKAKPADIKRYRESELVHGRVAMLAALGFVVGEQLEDFPAFINFDGSVTGPAIYQFQQVEDVRPLFWETLVLAIGLAETYRVSVGWATPTGNGFNNLKDEYAPGELGFDPLGIMPEDDEELFVMQTRELNNGRLAMIAVAGFVAQELLPPHQEIFEHFALYLERDVILAVEAVDPLLKVVPPSPVPGVPAGL